MQSLSVSWLLIPFFTYADNENKGGKEQPKSCMEWKAYAFDTWPNTAA